MNSDLTDTPVEQFIAIGSKAINSSKPLWRQLAVKMRGLGLLNTLSILGSLSLLDPRTVTYKQLNPDQRKQLEQILITQIWPLSETQIYLGNAKKRTVSDAFKTQSSLDGSNYILLENVLKSQQQLDIKRLARMNCYVGSRHGKYKVHGQSTKSTGRKNKMIKGFQKKRMNKDLNTKKVVKKEKS